MSAGLIVNPAIVNVERHGMTTQGNSHGLATEGYDQSKTPSPHVAVVGAGPVGMTLALALIRSGMSCDLIDPRGLEQEHPQAAAYPSDAEDHAGDTSSSTAANRPIALSLGSIRVLQGLGLWPPDGLSAHPPTSGQPILRVHVSQRGRFGVVRMNAADMGLDSFGYVLNSDDLQRELARRVACVANVCPRLRILQARVQSLATGAHTELYARRLVLEAVGPKNEQLPVDAPLFVDANLVCMTGGTRALGAHVHSRGARYSQSAVASVIRVSKPVPGTAFERFYESDGQSGGGIVGLLPMSGDHYGLVWSLQQSQAERLWRCEPAQFMADLQKVFGKRLGQILEVGARRMFPLALEIRRLRDEPRVVLLGGAVCRLHPVAGQALNLGIRDVAELLELLDVAQFEGRDIGAAALLRRYQSGRFWDRGRVGMATHALVSGFSLAGCLPAMLRSLAMFGLDASGGSKYGLARYACGLGPSPARLLARDVNAGSNATQRA